MSNVSADPMSAAMETMGEWADLESTDSTTETESDHLSDLSDLDDQSDGTSGDEVKSTPKEEASKDATTEKPKDGNLVEFKALGKVHQVPRPTDEQLPILLSKAYGADRKLEEANSKVKAAEAKLAEAQASTGKSADVERASKLMGLGHHREAVLELTKALGVDGAKVLESFLEDERAYAKADPSQRLLIDSERKTRSSELARIASEERLAKIDSDAEAAAEATRASQYSGYITDSFERYDLSQWIENADVAKSLNQTLKDSAMNVLGREQRKREAAKLPDLTNIEIRQIVAKQAKLLHGSYATSQEKKTSASAVEEKSKVAEQKMQASVSTGQTQDEKIAALVKRGASPTELAEAMFGKSRRLY